MLALISVDKSVLCQSLSGTISSNVTFSYEVCVEGWVGVGEGLLLLCQDEHLSPYDRHIPDRYLIGNLPDRLVNMLYITQPWLV